MYGYVRICTEPKQWEFGGKAPVKAARSAGREVSRRSDVAAQSEKSANHLRGDTGAKPLSRPPARRVARCLAAPMSRLNQKNLQITSGGVRGRSPCQGRPLGGARGVSPLRCRGSIRKRPLTRHAAHDRWMDRALRSKSNRGESAGVYYVLDRT